MITLINRDISDTHAGVAAFVREKTAHYLWWKDFGDEVLFRFVPDDADGMLLDKEWWWK